MTPKRIALALLCFALAAPSEALGGLITWELEGTIERVDVPVRGSGTYDDLYRAQVVGQLLEDAHVTVGAAWHARVSFESDVILVGCPECGDFAEFESA